MSTSTSVQQDASTENKLLFTSRTVTINPGGTKSVGVGVYDNHGTQPAFDLTFTPDVKKAVSTSLDRLDVPGKSKHMLLYRFRNNGAEACTIEVRRQAAAA